MMQFGVFVSMQLHMKPPPDRVTLTHQLLLSLLVFCVVHVDDFLKFFLTDSHYVALFKDRMEFTM